MAIETYRKKRDFAATPEPKGGRARKTGNSFVIQKHDATRLHYDFRLEMDGVLKSWAVTKGPSLIPGEKRLAVHVEDHPLEYGDFEGTIPKGEYGGGTVIVWDRGTWSPIGDAHKGYAKGHLDFELHGEKLGGHWHLVRMHGKPREKRENWLLIKGDDEFARPGAVTDILEERPESAKTGPRGRRGCRGGAGLVLKDRPHQRGYKGTDAAGAPKSTIAGASQVAFPDASKIKGAKKASMPDFLEPMLRDARLRAARRGPMAARNQVRRLSAPGPHRGRAGEAADAKRPRVDRDNSARPSWRLAGFGVGTAHHRWRARGRDDAGAPDFSALQADLSEGRSDRFVFYVFDLLYLDGYDLRALPLIERKSLLEGLVAARRRHDPLQQPFRARAAPLVLRHACRLSLEGHRLESSRRALSGGARQELGQVEMLGAAGIRGGRLRAVHHLEQRDRLAGARCL